MIDDKLVSMMLERVIQGWKADGRVILVGKSSFYEKVGKVGIFGQKWAVQIGAKTVFVPGSFEAVLAVVAKTFDNLSQGSSWVEKSIARVVFKAYQVIQLVRRCQFDNAVADFTLIGGDGVGVENWNSFDFFTLGSFEVVAK